MFSFYTIWFYNGCNKKTTFPKINHNKWDIMQNVGIEGK